jgi:hypothetical protein
VHAAMQQISLLIHVINASAEDCQIMGYTKIEWKKLAEYDDIWANPMAFDVKTRHNKIQAVDFNE